MRILQVISQLGNGGAEKLVVELSNQLNRENEIILLSFREIQDWMFFPKRIEKNIDLIELDKKKGFSILFLYKLYKILNSKKVDIIHIHLISTLQYFMFLIPIFNKQNFMYTIHNEFKSHETKMFKRLSKFWFFKRVKFICLSDNIRDEYKSEFPKLDFYTISNGISSLNQSPNFNIVKEEIKSIKNHINDKIFLFVGRLSEEKNIPLLLEVFSNLERCKLLIIGKDTTENLEFISKIEKNSSPNIIYLGAKENIADYMRCSDALVITSISEGLPIVALEALSIGLPILSTPVGSLKKIIIDWENGFLSSDIDRESYLKIVKIFLSLNIDEIEEIKRNNISLFKRKYSIEISANKHKKIYRKGL